jgi:hypothetical protein
MVNIQRLLDEGLFTASYKFALLLALAVLSIEQGDDSGEPSFKSATARFTSIPACPGTSFASEEVHQSTESWLSTSMRPANTLQRLECFKMRECGRVFTPSSHAR